MSDISSLYHQNNQLKSDFQTYDSSRFAKNDTANNQANLLRSGGQTMPPKPQQKPIYDELNALPSGKAFKEGSKILLPAKAFDVYHMNALYADTNNINGEVKEINGNLYARGENPIIEYIPKEQIIQPNNHISGSIKNAEADKRLENIKNETMPYDAPMFEMLPKVIGGAIIGAISGAVLHSPLLMLGSLGVGGASIYLANEHFKKLSPQSDDDFKKKITNFS
jgi:hypothetical protein